MRIIQLKNIFIALTIILGGYSHIILANIKTGTLANTLIKHRS